MRKLLVLTMLLLLGAGCQSNLGATYSLKASKEKILKSEIYKDDKGNKFVKYNYVSGVEVPKFSDKEDLSKRTQNSYTEIIGKKNKKDVLRTTFFSADSFKKEGNKWMQIETATTTENEFIKATKLTFVDKFKNLFGSTALADTVNFYPSLDGRSSAQQTATSFTNIRNGTNGTSNPDSTLSDPFQFIILASTLTENAFIYLTRSIFVFDTSDLPDTATVTDATLSLFSANLGSTNVNDCFATQMNITEASTVSSTILVANDFQNNKDFTTRFSNDFPLLSFNNTNPGGYNDFIFNNAGKAKVSLTGLSKFALKTGFDIDDSSPTWIQNCSAAQVHIYYSEIAGTDKDPKLTVTYTIDSTPSTSKSNIINFE